MSIESGTAVETYRVQGLVGAGAMGEVYLAVDEGLGRRVALKILSDTHRDNPELRARFIREARAVAAISHPNVVQVFTIGEHDGRPYFAMEYLAGKDLGTIVRATGPMTSMSAAAALLDAARGLQAAAEASLIHRDVKPSNLVKLDLGPVKVTDFGLAKPVKPTDDPALTALGVVVGTPDYIAPEQARGDDIDWRVDVYALGCTAYYLLVGKPPFRKGSEDDDKYIKVVARHLRDPAPDARDLNAGADDELATLALEMMRKVPAERPSYPELIEKLEHIHARLRAGSGSLPRARTAPPARGGGGGGTRPTPLPRPDGGTAIQAPPSQPSALSNLPVVHRHRSRWLWATTGVSIIVFIVGVGLTFLGKGPAADTGGARPPDTFAPSSSTATSKPPVAPLATSAAAVTSAPAGPATSSGAAAEPVPPSGMLLVRRPDGRPGFYVDRDPVHNKEYAELVPAFKFKPGDADDWAQGVSFADAARYAKLRDKRLLRDDEWDAALNTVGFVPAGMRWWEWVDDGDASPSHDRTVRRVESAPGKRPGRGDKAVTFRLAKDL